MASGDSLLVFEPLSNRPPIANYASVDLRSGFVVLDFDDTTDEAALFLSTLPSQYGGGQFEVVVTWTTTTAITGNAKLRVEATRISSGVNIDLLPTVDGTADIIVAAPTVSGQLAMAQTVPLNTGGAVAGDLLLIGMTRLASDAADTLVGDVEFLSLEVREV